MDVKQTIEDFLTGKMDIVEFRRLYDEGEEINDFLEGIIQNIRVKGEEIRKYTVVSGTARRETDAGIGYLMNPASYPGKAHGNPYTSVREMLNFELHMITHNVRCASGAFRFFNEVRALYHQIDQEVTVTDRYAKEYSFILEIVPEYLAGGPSEVYIQEQIIPLFPETMKKGERIKGIKAMIKSHFRSEKGYPAWIEGSDWPMGADGKPAVYLGSIKTLDGEGMCYIFRDESEEGDRRIIGVEQMH